MELGKITYEYGASPNEQEKAVAKALIRCGRNVEFIAAKRIPHYHTPDILMEGSYWEIKSLNGKSKRTLEHRLREATLQAENVIIDITQCKMKDNVAIKYIANFLPNAPKAKRVIIFDKNCKFLTIKGKVVL